MPALLVSLLASLLACVSGPAPSLDCTATVDEAMPLVIGVDWTAPDGSSSSVEFGPSPTYGQSPPSLAGSGQMHQDLIGNEADTDIYWRAVSTGADWVRECSGVTRTGSLPRGIPELSVTVNSAEDPDAMLIAAWYRLNRSGAVLTASRRDGTVVWYYEGTTPGSSLDVHYAANGSGLLYNLYGQAGMGGDDARIERISLAGVLLDSWSTPLAHHMFVELPDGTLTYNTTDIRAYTDPATGETADWTGDALVERHPSGSTTTVFSTWDALTPAANEHMADINIYGGVDWTHSNMVKHDPTRDQYLLSLANPGDILIINREDGALVQAYGPDGKIADPPFNYPHDPGWLDNGNLLMFMTDDTGSGAVEYALDDGYGREVWRYGFEEVAGLLGQAVRLDNGDTFINYGGASHLQQVTPEGVVVWEARPEIQSSPALVGQTLLTSNLYTGAP